MDKKSQFAVVIVMFTVVTVTTFPYLYAEVKSGDSYSFTGFLLNPLDGNSYLSKMYEGWIGDWQFTLPYTSTKGEGAYLFLFYLSLGHIGRLLGISLITIYHSARVISTLLMLFSLYQFLKFTLPSIQMRLVAFVLIAFGSGFGWVALLFNTFTSDFWVAEVYPFLSAFTNPHFPLGIAIILFLLTLSSNHDQQFRWDTGLTIFGALLLAIVMPFGVVICLIILSVLSLWENYPNLISVKNPRLGKHIYYLCLGGLPYLFYAYLSTITDPILSRWNSQNITLTPPVWDVFIALGPAIILAFIAIPTVIREKSRSGRLLIIWAILGSLLIYLPWGLQRRLMTALYIPIGTLAIIGLHRISKSRRMFFSLSILLFILVVPTNIVLLLATRQGVETKDPQLYLRESEVDAMIWLQKNTQPHDVILASPETGMFIPAYTGRRVIYGHPYETVEADAERKLLMNYYHGDRGDAITELMERVDYLYSGPRESVLGNGYIPPTATIVFQNSSVILYHLNR